MIVINKLLKSWLLAYIISIVGQRLLIMLFNLSGYVPLQHISQQLAAAYVLLFAVIFSSLLFDDIIYVVVAIIIVLIQPTLPSLLMIIFSLLTIYICQQLIDNTYELFGLFLTTMFIVILSIVILPLFHITPSLSTYCYQLILTLPPSFIKVISIILVFSLSTLLPNDINHLLTQLTFEPDTLALASAASTIFIISLATLCFYLGAIRESMIQSILIPTLQLINIIKQPIILMIPLSVTIMLSMMVYYIIPLNNSVASVFYGSSFFVAFLDGAKLNGGTLWAWTNVLTIYIILPMLLTWMMAYLGDKLKWFTKISMHITRQTFQ